MGDFSLQLRSVSQSSISAVTPRPSRSSISSTFPLSQSSLVSQLRRTSESAAHPPVSPSLAVPSPSAIPSFRSLRSLLPFAPAKTPNPPPAPVHTPKPSFVNFGSLRRSANDKKTSPPQEAEVPVIAIARPSQTFEEDMIARKHSRDANRPNTSPSDARTSEERYVLPLPSAGPPLGADLSTIIEAENSGISKHIPHLGDSTQAEVEEPPSPFNLEQAQLPSPDSRAASVLDLSTSRLAAEVMSALKGEDDSTASEWLRGVNGIVVEESTFDPDSHSRTPVNATAADEDLDTAMDFDALDPDLAELLSPNRMNGKSQGPNPPVSRIPSRTHSRSPSHPVSSSPSHLVNGNGLHSRNSPRLGIIVPPAASRAVVQPSPTRRSTSESRTSPIRGPPSSLPRLMRSVTNGPPSSSDSDGRSTPSTGLRGPSKKRYQPPSPLSSQTQSSQVPSPASSRGSTEMPPRRLAGSRLATPIRHVSAYTPASRLAEAHHPSTAHKPSTSSSTRSASDPTREPSTRPSLELNGTLEVNKRRRPHLFNSRRRSMSVEERLSTSGSTSPVRPSSSLSNRPVMEWLGPRTVKAFAAAGLLDGERDPHHHASTSGAGAGNGKYATLRGHNEREDRFAPSRMAFSEASTSSWGRSGSLSRMTPSEGGHTWGGSPTFSAPRTTFSSSTAPTSVSGSSHHPQPQMATTTAMQILKDKHELETEALLAALSDSQRTSKTLREENVQLRDRIRELEDELDGMRTQLHRLATGMGVSTRLGPSSALGRSSPLERTALLPSPALMVPRPTIQRSISVAHNRHSNGLSALSVVGRSAASSRAASPVRYTDSPIPPSAPVQVNVSSDTDLRMTMAMGTEVAAPHPRRRRASTTSSVFPNLPPNMSLLTSETIGMYDRTGVSLPPSPSPPIQTRGHKHVAANLHPSASIPIPIPIPTGNISPTTTSFCMTEIPGSPSSLELRPEHELHLGDMASASLYAMSDEEI